MMKFFAVLLLFVGMWAHAEIRPILYSLTKDGRVSYILGSYHMGGQFNEFPPYVAEKIRQEPLYLSESSVSDDQDNSPSPDYTKAPPLTNATIKKFIERGVPKNLIDVAKSQPGFGCFLYEYTEWFIDYHGTLDDQIYKYAKSHGKRAIDLDDASIDKVSQDLALCDSNQLVLEDSPAQARENFMKDLTDFRAGIIDPTNDEGDDVLEVSKRNKIWLPKILAAHQEGAFIVVGDGHLLGPNGLLALLEKAGFQVKRVEK